MRLWTEVALALGGDHRYRNRGRSRNRYRNRLFQTSKTDCDCDCDCDPDSDVSGILPLFSEQTHVNMFMNRLATAWMPEIIMFSPLLITRYLVLMEA